MIKRITSLLLVVALLTTSISWDDIVYAQPEGILYGDVDGDGDIDLQDLLLLEKFVAHNEEVIIDYEASDVNADGLVDDADVVLIKKYLAGWDVKLGPVSAKADEYYTISFDTNGGSTVDDIEVKAGTVVTDTIPAPTKEGFIFVKWIDSDGNQFYQSNPVNGDLNLKAVYVSEKMKENLSVDTFSLIDQRPDLAFELVSDYNTAAEVKNSIMLTPKDGTAQLDLNVVRNDRGTYTVTAVGGYNPGSTYELTVSNGVRFQGKEDTIVKASFVIAKAEKYNLKYNDNVKFMKDTEAMRYTLTDGNTVDMLDIAILSNSDNNDDIKGTFTYGDFPYGPNSIVCLYENEDPRNRDYTTSNYEDDSVAYIRITAINGNVVSFEGLDNADTGDVLFMPDSIPFSVNALPTGTSGTVNKDDYDAATWIALGKKDNPEYNVGDFLIFYEGAFSDATKDTSVYYGKVTVVNSTTVNYVKIDKSEIESSTGMYISNQVDSKTLASGINKKALEDQVAAQAKKSGFVDEAIACLADKIQNTESFQNAYNNMDTENQDVIVYNDKMLAAIPAGGAATKANKAEFTVEDVVVDSNFIYSDHFDDGVGIELGITATLSVTKKLTTGKEASLKIELSASIQQEIAVNIDVNVDTDWTVYVIIPVLTELYCNSAVEIESYSAISLGAKIYTVSEAVEKNWTALNNVLTDDMKGKLNADTIRKIDNLATRLKRLKKDSEEYKDTLQQIVNYKAMLPSIEVDGEKYSVEEVEESLGVVSVAEELGDLLDVDSPDEMDTGIADIMDKYGDMLENESDWVELYNKELFNRDFYINIVAINLKVNFIVKANVNIALAANIEYQIGKRYTFWVKVFSQQSGSDEVDLCDERFAFQFYIMGTLGVKAGIKAEVSVGLFSTKIGSIGVNVEFGPYFKLWGYFIYEYSKLRPAGKTEFIYDETMLGALYMEVGLYVTINFKAQLLDNTLKYEPTLYSGEFPLLTVGNKDNVYDFAMEGSLDDKLIVKDSDNNSTNGITMKLPDTYLNMKEIDLKTADKSQKVYPYGDFNYTFSSDKFSIDKDGIVSVTPGQFERYLTSNLTITWNKKVAFSDYDMSITIPVIWTDYTNTELKEKYTATVKVGNSTEGYVTKWSERYSRIDVFDLPSQDEILDMINYDSYDYNGTNVKYADKGNYKKASTGLTIDSDTVYYYDIDLKQYTIVVDDVENPDGTKTEKHYTVTYGEDYDLTDLQSSGTDDANNDKYTKFYNLIDSLGNEIDLTGTANMAFIKAIQSGDVSLTANYVDDYAEATYVFNGLDVPSVTIKFKKGEIPDFDYAKYLNDYDAKALDIYPIVAPSYTSVTYNLSCKSTVVINYYDMIFNTNGGTNINTRTYPQGSIITCPMDPEKDGYTFAGWYTDDSYTTAYQFTDNGQAAVMPDHNVELYAKWIANTYNVSFMSEGGNMGSSSSDMEVTFGQNYGTLPIPTLTNYRFLGWYTDVNDESTKVTADSIYSTVGDQTLHAKWYEKENIVLPDAVFNTQTVTFTENTEFEFDLDLSKYNEYKGPDWGFIIRYLKEGTNGTPTTTKPTQSGTYKVYISRTDDPTTDEDDNYLDYTNTTKIAKLQVNKADFSISGFKLFSYSDVIVVQTPRDIPGDGQVQYKLINATEHKESDWQSSPVFEGIDNGRTYYAVIKVGEGTNYNAASERNSDNDTTLNYSTDSTYIYYRIKTYENGFGDTFGTDSTIKGHAQMRKPYNNSKLQNVSMEQEFNYHDNDFENGDDDLYYVCCVNAPWEIGKAVLTNTGSDEWKVKSIKVGFTSEKLSQDDLEDNNDGSINYVGTLDDLNATLENSSREFDCPFMIRKITDVGDFNRALSAINLDDMTRDYEFSYNGKVTDNFYSNYNAYEKFSAPILKASFSSSSTPSKYDRFISYTSCKDVSVDYDGLRTQMKRDGITKLTLYFNLSFSSTTTTDETRTWTNYVNFTCSANNKLTSNQYAAPTYSCGMKALSYLEGQNDILPILISARTASASEGDLVDVTLDVAQNPGIWGILADITYDHNALQLVSYKAGSIFKTEDIYGPESLDQDKYTLLASNSVFNNLDNNGDLITLTFKVKQNTKISDYPIGVSVSQIINADGMEIMSSVTNGAVKVQDKVIDNGDDGNDVPDTGDSSNLILALEEMIFGLGLFVIAYKHKNKNRRVIK